MSPKRQKTPAWLPWALGGLFVALGLYSLIAWSVQGQGGWEMGLTSFVLIVGPGTLLARALWRWGRGED